MANPKITRSDIAAHVEMGKLSGGYFSDPDIAQAFIDIAVKEIVPTLGGHVNYGSFGGGEGYLTKRVADFIGSGGRGVSTLIVDANPDYLAKAAKMGLAAICADLSEIALSGFDLITMRSVNHYNAMSVQQQIVDAAFSALSEGGWLISQNLSGPSEAYCRLASQLSKFTELGRIEVDRGEPHIASGEEFIDLMECAGFEEIRIAGYAPSIQIGPDWYWERFNYQLRKTAVEAGDAAGVRSIDERRRVYFEEANEAIAAFLENASEAEAAPIDWTEHAFTLDLSFPVFVGRKRPAG